MLRDLIRGALETLQCSAGENATYARGNATVEVSVLPGQAGFTTDPRRGLVVHSDDQDWLLPADELILSGQVTTPQRGDRLTLIRDGVTCVYEVLPADGQTHRLDQTGTLLRIHSKLKSRT